MLSLDFRRRRRRRFLERIANPTLLFAGGEVPRNTPFQTYAYRADSNFLLFFDPPEPGSVALFDPGDGTVTLFVPDRTVEAATWNGPMPSFDEVKQKAGVDRAHALGSFRETLQGLVRGRPLDALAVADPLATLIARDVTGQDLVFTDPSRIGPPVLVDVLAAMRIRKEPEEVEEIGRAADVTREAHLAVLEATSPGASEQELTALFEFVCARHSCVPAYGTILSARGEILHNPDHSGSLRAGDLLLVDAGAETPRGYGADVTRTWPASGRFDPAQAAVYDAVLAAQLRAIELARPGTRFRDVHFGAAHVLAEHLVDMGLLRGSASSLVERGAHALFFPHGIGHLLGLDTHDLRIFGDRVLYPGRARSTEFGTDMLRIDLDLAPGMVITIEPGCYFVGAILRRSDLRERFRDACDFDRAERFLARDGGRGFGGVRIEDDVVVTTEAPHVPTSSIPKRRDEIEALAGRRAAEREPAR
jgi:Xaa-Pro aminopeptidase